MRTATKCPSCGSPGYIQDYPEAPNSRVKYLSRLEDKGTGRVRCKKCGYIGTLESFKKAGMPASTVREDIPVEKLTPRARRLYREHLDDVEYRTRHKGE